MSLTWGTLYFVSGEKCDYLSCVIEMVKKVASSNSAVYYTAAHLSGDCDVLVAMGSPISRSVAVTRLSTKKDVYTYYSADALSAIQAAVSALGSGFRYAGAEIDQERKDGYIYYYHYHVCTTGGFHLSHAWFGNPYTK